MTTENNVGRRLKALRISHKMSQQEFGDIGLVNRSYVSQVESGRKPSADYLNRIASHFMITPSELSMEPKAIGELRDLIEIHKLDDVIAGLEAILDENKN